MVEPGGELSLLRQNDEEEANQQEVETGDLRLRSPWQAAVCTRRIAPAILGLGLCILAIVFVQCTIGRRRRIPPGESVGQRPARRLGSFLVLGDWGHDETIHGDVFTSACQQAIASAMHEKMKELGDVRFLINVGDSFYPRGVTSKDDPQWDAKWRSRYSAELRSIPWYSVYGNHDYQSDPCACGDDAAACAQVNADWSNRNFFYMPSYAWWRQHPELDLEVIALELNNYQTGWDDSKPVDALRCDDCIYSPCPGKCQASLKARSEESFNLFYDRAARSPAKNLLVFSHYPTDYFKRVPRFLQELSNSSRHIEYFAGHRHNVDLTSTISTAPNNNWLVGGGGGWSCEHYSDIRQGFVVGEIGTDGSLYTYSVLVDPAICCSLALPIHCVSRWLPCALAFLIFRFIGP